MRILHALPHLSSGGAERQLAWLLPELVGQGHEPHVAYLYDGPQPEQARTAGVQFHRLQFRGNHDPRMATRLIGLFRRIRPDVAHTWIPQMDVMAGMAARWTRTPWVLREPSCAAAYSLHGWKLRLRIRAAAAANVIVANSEGGRDYWREHYPAKDLRVVPNGIDLEAIESAPRISPDQLGARGDLPLIGFAGRLEASKNVGTMLSALDGLRPDRTAGAILCGEGSERAALEARARDLGLSELVRFAGHVPGETVWGVMRSCAAFVFLSEFEGFPNVIAEAMAAGCPILASDIPAHRGLLDSTVAFLVDPGDPGKVRDALRSILGDSADAAARAARARARAREYSIPLMARRYVEIYESAASRVGLRVS